MSHLSQLRKFRTIAVKAIAQYPLRNVRIDYIGHAENVVYKITATEGVYLLRIHARSFRTAQAIEQELQYIALLRADGFDLQVPLKSINDDQVMHIDGNIITVLSWQLGNKKHKSIRDEHFEILGDYLAKLHSFSLKNNHKIASNHREYWTADNLIGSNPILGAFTGLEAYKDFDRNIFETTRLQTLYRLRNHQENSPQRFGMIHADLHFGNILWHKNKIRAIDFDDCGIGSYLHDLSIPIISINSATPQHHRDILLNAYCKIHSLNQSDLGLIDDYILSRHIAMTGWASMRADLPKTKKYLEQRMNKIMKILRTELK